MRLIGSRVFLRSVRKPLYQLAATALLVAAGPVLGQQLNGEVNTHRARATGRTTFLRAERGGIIPVTASRPGQAPTAADFLRDHGPQFGVQNPTTQLAAPAIKTDAIGFQHTSYQQIHKGVPVFSGVLRLHQNAAGFFTAANGRVHAVPGDLNIVPKLNRNAAVATATARLGAANPEVEKSELVIVDPGWYGDPPAGAHLAYHVVLTDLNAGIREAFFVSAHTGKILDQWNLLEHAKFRVVTNDATGMIVRTEGDPATGDFEADAAYDYTGDYYDYFQRAFGRDSIDDAGAALSATVHLQSTSCPNAFGGAGGTFYCDGIVTDDIVAHEFTHGLTDYTANLIYQNQPGQLNESFSDVFGEVIDLLNGDAAFAGAPGGTPWPPHDTGSGTDTPNTLRTTCEASTFMTINSPAPIAGDYPAQAASFGPALTAMGVSGDLVVADPLRGCDEDLPFTNAGDFAGKIVLMRRGDCFFTVKVANAQDEGAPAVIIMNNSPAGPAPMGGTDPSITIPSLGITEADGNMLIAEAQSGTINVTLRANETPRVRWLVSEDSSGFGGAIRDMWQPSCAGDPDTANHPNQTCNPADNGGVHSGSGVPNHAFAMLTDGKDFNGQNVNGIGLFKAAAVWYRALTVYLTPSSNFQDAYLALNQSAADLIGTIIKDPRDGSDYGVFTSADAQEVDKALLAVEMNTPGLCGDSLNVLDPTPPTLCESRTALYADDFESGTNGWTVSSFGPTGPPTPYDWVQTSGLPLSRPGVAWYADDPPIGNCSTIDESALHTLFSPVIALPGALVSPQMMFTHFVETEAFYDGGNVKVSIDDGPWQLIPKTAFTHNRYNSDLAAGGTSPIAGQPAWSGLSYDGPQWGASVVDLSGFVSGGENIQFRFDFGKDGCTGFTGWFVDDFEVFVCADTLAAPMPEPDGVAMNRFVSFLVSESGQETALRVELSTINHPRFCCADGSGTSCSSTTCDVHAHCAGVGGNPVCAHQAGDGAPLKCCSDTTAASCHASATCTSDANCVGVVGFPECEPMFKAAQGKIRYVNAFRYCSNNPFATCQGDEDCPAIANRCSTTALPCPPDACATGVCGGPGTCVETLHCADDGAPFNTAYPCATLGCEPEYRDWGADLANPLSNEPQVPGLLFVTGDAMVPSSTLNVTVIGSAEVCGPTAATANTCTAASAPLALGTTKWGDITGASFSPPDGKSDVLDIPAVINKLKTVPTFFVEPRTWLKIRDPKGYLDAITVIDLSDVIDAGPQGKAYPATRFIDACSHD